MGGYLAVLRWHPRLVYSGVFRSGMEFIRGFYMTHAFATIFFFTVIYFLFFVEMVGMGWDEMMDWVG